MHTSLIVGITHFIVVPSIFSAAADGSWVDNPVGENDYNNTKFPVHMNSSQGSYIQAALLRR